MPEARGSGSQQAMCVSPRSFSVQKFLFSVLLGPSLQFLVWKVGDTDDSLLDMNSDSHFL